MSGFQTMVSNLLTQQTTAYQWGNAVPMHPAVFQATLMGLATAENINWPSQDAPDDQTQAANNAVLKYAVFYQHLLAKVQYEPEPSNPPDTFHQFWVATKAVVGS